MTENSDPGPVSIAARLKAALPGPASAIIGSFGWSCAMGASAALAGVMKSWAGGGNLVFVTASFAAGGFAAYVPALIVFRMFGARKARSQRLALIFLALTAATILCTNLAFALIYRTYYAQWHGDVLSGDWLRQQFFTTASSTYQFAVIGLRSYFPLGITALFAASWLISKKPV